RRACLLRRCCDAVVFGPYRRDTVHAVRGGGHLARAIADGFGGERERVFQPHVLRGVYEARVVVEPTSNHREGLRRGGGNEFVDGVFHAAHTGVAGGVDVWPY